MSKSATLQEATAPIDASHMPLDTKFTLSEEITPIQQEFLEVHGFLHFEGVANEAEVLSILSEVDRIQEEWIQEERKEVYGIPLFKGAKSASESLIQRMPFTSCFSPMIKDFVRDSRFEPVRKLVGEDARVGDQEKDGVVVNTYINVPGSVYPRLGWHTDGLRDLAYLKMPAQMLNVGLHLTDCPMENGGLRLLPGTHKQGFFSMCLKKLYFISHKPDPQEVCVETKAGDLTVHDGRLWHRVEQSPHMGNKSLRRSMYVPYLTDPFHPKGSASKTPFYHYLGMAGRAVKTWGWKRKREQSEKGVRREEP